jgi:outer membrane protein assembly factor BamD
MNRWCAYLFLALLVLALFPSRSPAPLVYRAGEGWSYESPSGKVAEWRKLRASTQLEVAQKAYDDKDYSLALKAARRVVTIWPLSDYAAGGQYLVGKCYEATRKDEKAFNAYNQLLSKWPKTIDATEVQKRQFDIAGRFLGGEWFKLWGYIPFFPSMDKTAEMYEKIVRFGPYGPYAPPSQMNIGAAREKEKDYPLAVKAYETAADRYAGQPAVAADAIYKEGMAFNKQARKAGYDQSISDQAISTFKDFMTLYPDDPRGADAKKLIATLVVEKARGYFAIAEYYEKHKRYNGLPNLDGALIYYNEVHYEVPGTPLGDLAEQRVATIKQRQAETKQHQAAK